jgi:quercetin dioxygenase-like cupin family protein
MIIDDGNVRLELLKTEGEVLEMVATYRAGSPAPPRHFHPQQEERFEIREGALWFEIDGVARIVRAGDVVIVPPRGVHRARNASSGEPAVVLWQTRPALRSAKFFESMYLASRNKSVLRMVATAAEFRDEFVLASPPRVVQSCLFAVLAPIARVLGKAP